VAALKDGGIGGHRALVVAGGGDDEIRNIGVGNGHTLGGARSPDIVLDDVTALHDRKDIVLAANFCPRTGLDYEQG